MGNSKNLRVFNFAILLKSQKLQMFYSNYQIMNARNFTSTKKTTQQ